MYAYYVFTSTGSSSEWGAAYIISHLKAQFPKLQSKKSYTHNSIGRVHSTTVKFKIPAVDGAAFFNELRGFASHATLLEEASYE